MRIATFNVNSIAQRVEPLKQWLKEREPDVVCLQELKCVDQAFPRGPFEDLGYNVATHGQKTYNGVAILSKLKFDEVEARLPGDKSDEQARYLEAVISVKGGVVRVASIYLPNGNPIGTEKFDYKLRWMERLEERAKELLADERPVILAGDFNVVPEDRDVFSIRAASNDALVQPETRAQWRRMLNQGWTEALRAFHPNDDHLYTFWDYTAGCWQRDAGFRIDHLLCSPEAADRLQNAGVDKWARGEEKASDHAPTWVELA